MKYFTAILIIIFLSLISLLYFLPKKDLKEEEKNTIENISICFPDNKCEESLDVIDVDEKNDLLLKFNLNAYSGSIDILISYSLPNSNEKVEIAKKKIDKVESTNEITLNRLLDTGWLLGKYYIQLVADNPQKETFNTEFLVQAL